MEEDMEPSGGSTMVPIALAVLAIVLGGAGLYFGMTANQRIAPLTDSVDEGTSSSARLEKQISSLETRITELSSELTKLKGTVQRAGRETSQAIRDASASKQTAAANRQEIIKLATVMQELAKSGRKPAASSSSNTSTSQSASSGDSAPETSATDGDASTYTIESGDTFGKIASKLGVSLDALLDANPDADPRRLRIGQEINIPSN